MKTYSSTLVLTFLLLPIASGILFTAPTFGDSLSGSETFDAQQFLSEAKAQQIAEAGKQGALIGLIVSLVIAYVMSPIDQQRWLKVVIVISVVTGGYFSSTISAKNRGISGKVTLELQSGMSRARVKRAVRELDNEIMRMDRMGTDQRGTDKILDSLYDVVAERETAVTAQDAQMFDEQIKRMVPALQKQLDAIVGMSDSAADFNTKFSGMGLELAQAIADATDVPIEEILDQIRKQLKAQALGKQIEKDRDEDPERRSAAIQTGDATAAGQRLATGRSMTLDDGSTVAIGGLNQDQMERFSDPNERAKLEKLRDVRERGRKAATIPATVALKMTRSERAAYDKAVQDETDATDSGDTEDIKAAKEATSDAMRAYLERVFGAENVTATDVATAMEKSYGGGDSLGKFLVGRRKQIGQEALDAQFEAYTLEQHFMGGSGALSGSQLFNLLQNPKLFDALARDIDLYMKSMSKEKIEPVEDTNQVTPGSTQTPTAAEKMQSSKPYKRPIRRRRMKNR